MKPELPTPELKPRPEFKKPTLPPSPKFKKPVLTLPPMPPKFKTPVLPPEPGVLKVQEADVTAGAARVQRVQEADVTAGAEVQEARVGLEIHRRRAVVQEAGAQVDVVQKARDIVAGVEEA